jgi:hypothetical protein
MAWTDTQDFKVGQLVTHVAAAEKGSLESLRQNLDFLHKRSNAVKYVHDGTGADWTTTSTEMIDIDATKFYLTIVSTGGPILTWFQGSNRRSGGSAYYTYFTIARVGDLFDNAEPNYPLWANRWKPIALWKPYWNLEAGSHTFTVRWQISGGTLGTALKADACPAFYVIEGM